jgi:small subunit ribosomal protein S19
MADRVFKFRGKTLEELKTMSIKDFAQLVKARKRRSLLRGIDNKSPKILSKVESEKKKLRTHRRDVVIIPSLIGKTIEVYNGQKFIPVTVTEEMLGHYLGEFSQTRRVAQHKGVGVGATKSSKHMGTK